MKLNVENRTEEVYIIYVNQERLGEIKASSKEEFLTGVIPPFKFAAEANEAFLIVVKKSGNEVVYSDNFTWKELNDMRWKIIIPDSFKNQ